MERPDLEAIQERKLRQWTQEPPPVDGIYVPDMGEAMDDTDSLCAYIAHLESELQTARDALPIAFQQGAKWWEWHSSGATMWSSDSALAWDEAQRKAADGSLGIAALRELGE